jgi:hypothetical protein
LPGVPVLLLEPSLSNAADRPDAGFMQTQCDPDFLFSKAVEIKLGRILVSLMKSWQVNLPEAKWEFTGRRIAILP